MDIQHDRDWKAALVAVKLKRKSQQLSAIAKEVYDNELYIVAALDYHNKASDEFNSLSDNGKDFYKKFAAIIHE